VGASLSLHRGALERVDRLVREGVFPSRSQAIQVAVKEKLKRLERSRPVGECAKLDPGIREGPSAEIVGK